MRTGANRHKHMSKSKSAEHRFRWSEPAYKGAMRCKAQCQEKLEASRGPAYPPMHQTHEKGALSGSPIAYSCHKGNAPSWTGSKLLSHERHERRGVMRGCVATPTGRLRKGKPAEAASKRISAPGSQGAQQVSQAWLDSLATPSRVALSKLPTDTMMANLHRLGWRTDLVAALATSLKEQGPTCKAIHYHLMKPVEGVAGNIKLRGSEENTGKLGAATSSKENLQACRLFCLERLYRWM